MELTYTLHTHIHSLSPSFTRGYKKSRVGGNNASAAWRTVYPTKLQFGGCNSAPEKWPPHTAWRGPGRESEEEEEVGRRWAQGASRQGAGGGRDLSTARSALTRRRKLERYCISEAMIAPRRLALNCIRPLQEFSRHYGTPRLSPHRVYIPSWHFPCTSSTHDETWVRAGRQVFRWMSVAKY